MINQKRYNQYIQRIERPLFKFIQLFSSVRYQALFKEILQLRILFFCKYNQLHNSYIDPDRRPPWNLLADPLCLISPLPPRSWISCDPSVF